MLRIKSHVMWSTQVYGVKKYVFGLDVAEKSRLLRNFHRGCYGFDALTSLYSRGTVKDVAVFPI